MAALSNDPARCELMNLGYEAQGHGPYLVRQEGYPPGSSDFRPQHFLLQRVAIRYRVVDRLRKRDVLSVDRRLFAIHRFAVSSQDFTFSAQRSVGLRQVGDRFFELLAGRHVQNSSK